MAPRISEEGRYPGRVGHGAIAGYGRHGVLHEDRFFELAGDLPVVVEFVVTEVEAARLTEIVGAERASLFYVKAPVEFGG